MTLPPHRTSHKAPPSELRQQTETTPSGLLLGWHSPATTSFGYAAAQKPLGPEQPLWYNGDGHLITIAPTRSGKGRGVLIPNLLLYPGTTIVFDPRGELYRVTARRRRQQGHRVLCLDPWGLTGPDSDRLNPFDIFGLDGADLETDAQLLASWLGDGNRFSTEPFWDLQGSALHSAVIAHVASALPLAERNLESARKLLMGDDTVYGLAALLDNAGKGMNAMAHDEIAAFLQTTDVTRSGILATALAYIKPFLSPRLAGVLSDSTFALREVIDGAPLTFYMVLPIDKLKSHKALLKMWVGTLLKAVMDRKQMPEQRTLLLMDECAQLENFPYLETVITLCAGTGVQCWSFWQDLSQLKKCYPASWETILNNCAVLQTFGINNRRMATQWEDYLEVSPQSLAGLPREQQVVQIQGEGALRCRRPDYLTDALFADLYDDNPLYQRRKAAPSRQIGEGGSPAALCGIPALARSGG